MLGKRVSDEVSFVVRWQTRETYQHHTVMGEVLPKYKFAKILILSHEQRASLIRPAQHDRVVDTRAELRDVEDLMAFVAETATILPIEVFVGHEGSCCLVRLRIDHVRAQRLRREIQGREQPPPA